MTRLILVGVLTLAQILTILVHADKTVLQPAGSQDYTKSGLTAGSLRSGLKPLTMVLA